MYVKPVAKNRNRYPIINTAALGKVIDIEDLLVQIKTMKQPISTRLLSYLSDQLIEESQSSYNPVLQVCLKNDRYMLKTENAIYSYADLYDNFSQSFERIKIKSLPITETLILGIGLGSIPFMLENRFGRKYHYSVVEIDAEVLRLFKTYVLDELLSPFDIRLADALHFDSYFDQKFDLICVDVFTDVIVPENLETLDFLETLKENLNPNGVLLFNKLAASLTDKKQAGLFFKNYFSKVFPNGKIIDTGTNYILLNDARFDAHT